VLGRGLWGHCALESKTTRKGRWPGLCGLAHASSLASLHGRPEGQLRWLRCECDRAWLRSSWRSSRRWRSSDAGATSCASAR
jgi:hypothetical protein